MKTNNPKIKTETDPPRRLRSMVFPDAEWEDAQAVARDESKRICRYVTASDVVRDGTKREVRRLRKRLDSK